jgi:hypothetical protein
VYFLAFLRLSVLYYPRGHAACFPGYFSIVWENVYQGHKTLSFRCFRRKFTSRWRYTYWLDPWFE